MLPVLLPVFRLSASHKKPSPLRLIKQRHQEQVPIITRRKKPIATHNRHPRDSPPLRFTPTSISPKFIASSSSTLTLFGLERALKPSSNSGTERKEQNSCFSGHFFVGAQAHSQDPRMNTRHSQEFLLFLRPPTSSNKIFDHRNTLFLSEGVPQPQDLSLIHI